MKNLSIRWKMALWFAISLLFVMSVMYAAIHVVLKETLMRNAESIIKAYSAQASSYIEAEDGAIKFDENMPNKEEGIFYQIYDSSDQFVYSNGIPNDLSALPQNFNQIRVVSINGTNWILYDQKFEEDNNSIGWIRSAKSLSYIDETLRNLFIIFLCLCPVFLAISLLVGYFLVRKTLQPIDQITTAARRIGQGDLSQRLHMKNTGDEVGRLSATFDEMIERLETAFLLEKQFTSDASHELRTPITVITAYAENATGEDSTPEENTHAMEVILKESKKMSATISSLLMLTRGDQHRYQPNLESIDLGQLVDDVTEEMETSAEQKGVSISVLPHSSQFMKLDQTLITNLLLNLIGNAVKYNRAGGHVEISIATDRRNAVLTIKDDGIGISEEDLPKVFNRFFRSEHSGDTEGTGLGLAIAKWIVDVHRGEIRIDSELSVGTTVTVNFPVTHDLISTSTGLR
jgi:signal transduction histidine kinase